MKLFFATDIHGSETCWRKFLNSGLHYRVDAIILGGDMTGKALVPIINDGGENWHSTLLENTQNLTGDDWGLWRTITRNLDSVAAHLSAYDVDRDLVSARLDDLQRRIDAAPKSRGWRLRDRIGERKRWYELPEEV